METWNLRALTWGWTFLSKSKNILCPVGKLLKWNEMHVPILWMFPIRENDTRRMWGKKQHGRHKVEYFIGLKPSLEEIIKTAGCTEINTSTQNSKSCNNVHHIKPLYSGEWTTLVFPNVFVWPTAGVWVEVMTLFKRSNQMERAVCFLVRKSYTWDMVQRPGSRWYTPFAQGHFSRTSIGPSAVSWQWTDFLFAVDS